jgi:hypothetical protein
MKILRSEPALRIAASLVLGSLVLMGAGVVVPLPLAVIAAMSIGQGLGILGVALFAFVVLRDIRHVFRRRRSAPPPPPSERGDTPRRRAAPLSSRPAPPEPPEPPTAADVDFDDAR